MEKYSTGVLAGYEKPKKLSPKEQKELRRINAKTTQVQNDAKTKHKQELELKAKKRRVELAKRDPFVGANPEVRTYSADKSCSDTHDKDFKQSKSVKSWQGGGCTPK